MNVASLKCANNFYSGNNLKVINQKELNYIQQVKNDNPELQFSKSQFNESLIRKYNSEGLFKGYTTYEGSINDKPVYLKRDFQRTSLIAGSYSYSGTIGEDKVNITIAANKVTGRIGDKEIDLNFNPSFLCFKPYSINGKIGDKDINITQGSSLESANGENDIITLITLLEGYKFTFDNQSFGRLSLSNQANLDQEEAMMCVMMQQQTKI